MADGGGRWRATNTALKKRRLRHHSMVRPSQSFDKSPRYRKKTLSQLFSILKLGMSTGDLLCWEASRRWRPSTRNPERARWRTSWAASLTAESVEPGLPGPTEGLTGGRAGIRRRAHVRRWSPVDFLAQIQFHIADFRVGIFVVRRNLIEAKRAVHPGRICHFVGHRIQPHEVISNTLGVCNQFL
jgi:hypothetical protein